MRVQCLRLEQPIGEFYLVSLKSDFLNRVSHSKAASIENDQIDGQQRQLDTGRINEIRSYLSTYNASIPNTIILSANYYKNDELEVDGDKRWRVDKEGDHYYLEIPNEELEICSIIDGQHRINGFSDSNVVMDLPCSIFLELPPSLQALIFSTINFNQRKVDKSLAYQLFGYQLDESESMSWSPDILAVKLSREFNSEGALKNRIKLIKSDYIVTEGWTISSAAFIEGVVSLISGNAKSDKYTVNKKKVIGYGSRSDLKYNDKYPLRRFYIDGNDLAIKMVLDRYFDALQDSLWKEKTSDSIVFRTVGIAAQFSFLKELILNEKVILDKDLDFSELLKNFNEISFSEEYFSARTATKSRLLDVFRLKIGLISKDGLDQAILNAAGD